MAKQHSLDGVFREIDYLREKVQAFVAVSPADQVRKTKALAILEGTRMILKASCISAAGDDYYEFDFVQK